jgi:hypothetical protein
VAGKTAATRLNARVSYRPKRNINDLASVLATFPRAGAQTIKRKSTAAAELAGFSALKSSSIFAGTRAPESASLCKRTGTPALGFENRLISLKKLDLYSGFQALPR